MIVDRPRLSRLIVAVLIVTAAAGCAKRDLAEPPDTESAIPPAGSTGDIPPEDRWVGRRHDPPSGLEEGTGPNIRVNQDTSGFDQNETVIAANPLDPMNLIGGANDYRNGNVGCGFYASADGGQTWVDGVLPEETYDRQGDPVVAFCADGSAMFICLSFNGAFQPHGLFAYRSKTLGVSWDGPFVVVDRPDGDPFADKPWAGCDTTSGPFANRVYVSWTDFSSAQKIVLRHSSDFGSNWSGTRFVSDGSTAQGSVITFTPDGVVHLAWRDTSSGSRIGYDRSTDGGDSFGVDRFPETIVSIPGDPVFRRNSHPVMDADRSAGPHSGNLYVAWSDNRNGDPDILLVRSTDGGDTWGAPIRVNDDPFGNGRDQWFPWMSVDPEGRVVIAFLDRRRDPSNRVYEIWGAVSRDGGQTFDTNFLISDTPSNGNLNDFIGDYSGLAATSDHLYPLWTDLRPGTGESDVYTDRFPNTFRYDEVTGLAWEDRDTLGFNIQDDRFGQDLEYDVASGFVGELRLDGSFDRAGCAAPSWPGSPFVDSREPPAGDGYYYLIRARGPDGVGTYGDGTPARPNVRDPLDESVSPCP